MVSRIQAFYSKLAEEGDVTDPLTDPVLENTGSDVEEDALDVVEMSMSVRHTQYEASRLLSAIEKDLDPLMTMVENARSGVQPITRPMLRFVDPNGVLKAHVSCLAELNLEGDADFTEEEQEELTAGLEGIIQDTLDRVHSVFKTVADRIGRNMAEVFGLIEGFETGLGQLKGSLAGIRKIDPEKLKKYNAKSLPAKTMDKYLRATNDYNRGIINALAAAFNDAKSGTSLDAKGNVLIKGTKARDYVEDLVNKHLEKPASTLYESQGIDIGEYLYSGRLELKLKREFTPEFATLSDLGYTDHKQVLRMIATSEQILEDAKRLRFLYKDITPLLGAIERQLKRDGKWFAGFRAFKLRWFLFWLNNTAAFMIRESWTATRRLERVAIAMAKCEDMKA